MSVAEQQLFLCSCNGTVPVDRDALARALALPAAPQVHSMLCQKELAAFADHARGDVVVGCTQEARLFEDIAGEAARTQAIRFVNLREAGGWSPQARGATPKLAALLAQAALPDPPPVPVVSYRSEGQLLIVGPLAAALPWAALLDEKLAVTVLATEGRDGSELPIERAYPIHTGTLTSLSGWLGAFEATWTQDNPIDLDVCTRCNACIRACPEQAIGFDYQVDLDRCRDHRDCVTACGAVGAIDFERREREHRERFDLVLDLGAAPRIATHVRPQGYFAPGADPTAQVKAASVLATMVGEFEKPKYFSYKASICAHARSRKEGCRNCLDACDAGAIFPDGDLVRVEPHLCMGCGTCTTVCPSGALTYAYPSPAETGARLRALLGTYARAGGRDACILLHGPASAARIARYARHGRGLPARVIPFEMHSVESAGLDLWLAAIAWGAVEVVALVAREDVAHYRRTAGFQMEIGDTLLNALGYQGRHFDFVDGDDIAALDRRLWEPPPLGVRSPATFGAGVEKRTMLYTALDHLAEHAPVLRERIPLPAGSPFGAIVVDGDKCTLCLACVGACPEGAIEDNVERPQLRFIEQKCVQCGICARTCPEQAITLVPQLDLTRAARGPRVVAEAAIFPCIRCGKPLGTEKMIGAMLARLSSHAMFAAPGSLDRLKMCADCRVVDLIKSEDSLDIRNL